MSAQPANTEIKVYRNVRAMRNRRLHDSVGSVIKRLRPLVMNVPGHDGLSVVVESRSAVKDFSPYAREGFPIVVGHHGNLAFADAVEGLADIDFPFTIGGDKFITNTAAGLDGDIQQDLRDIDDSSATNPTV